MNQSLLRYNFPEDLKAMEEKKLDLLAVEIREFLIDTLSKTGGHVSSNLGVVELSIALHRVFNSPVDKIIWDVGHQSYVHKILTGRAAEFHGLRTFGGISGFPKREESPHDMFDTGHSSNSISAGMGFASARDLKGEDYSVISVIGDGALTGGMAYEGLNNAGSSNSKMIVILNDNNMSISPNTGGMAQHLGNLRASKAYLEFKKKLKKTLNNIPGVGKNIYGGLEHIRDTLKYAIVPGAIFEELGFKYLGSIDGHNIKELTETLEMAKNFDEAVLIHAITKKGKGYKNAELYPSKFHGMGPFDKETGKSLSVSSGPTYSETFGEKMLKLGVCNPKVLGVCAAMQDGTGMDRFAKEFPDRFFDGAIAEAHVVTFAAGLAANGFRPVVAIYSTFLQRAYDQIMIDVAMQNLPVIFAIDRGGIVGADGETHHGVFDISFLSHIPNLCIMAPKDGNELEDMMDYALTLNCPVAIRYPRGNSQVEIFNTNSVFAPKSEIIFESSNINILALGNMVEKAFEVCKLLKEKNIDVGLVNARFVKPLDSETIISFAKNSKYLITLEDNVLDGGFGSQVNNLLNLSFNSLDKKANVLNIGWPDRFIEHGSINELFKTYKMDSVGIAERISDFIEGKA